MTNAKGLRFYYCTAGLLCLVVLGIVGAYRFHWRIFISAANPHSISISTASNAATSTSTTSVDASFHVPQMNSANQPWKWVSISMAKDSQYSEDGSTIAYEGNPILDADQSTFLVATDLMSPTAYERSISGPITYAKDKNFVYFGHDGGIGAPDQGQAAADIVIGADASTFTPIYDDKGYFTYYAKDRNGVYFGGIPFEPGVVDVATFIVLPSGEPPDPYVAFSKDKNHVYTLSGIVAFADPATFEFIGEAQHPINTPNNVPIYGKDKNSVFESKLLMPAKMISGVDEALSPL